MRIDVGCGRALAPGHTGVDLERSSDAKVVASAHAMPLLTGSVDEVMMSHILEHFQEPERLLAEAHRVLRPGGVLTIVLPHYSSPAAHHPQHRWTASLQVLRWWARAERPCGWRWRLYKLPEFVAADTPVRRFRLASRRLVFNRMWRRLGIEWLANVYPEAWEGFMLGLVQARDIEARLVALPVGVP